MLAERKEARAELTQQYAGLPTFGALSARGANLLR